MYVLQRLSWAMKSLKSNDVKRRCVTLTRWIQQNWSQYLTHQYGCAENQSVKKFVASSFVEQGCDFGGYTQVQAKRSCVKLAIRLCHGVGDTYCMRISPSRCKYIVQRVNRKRKGEELGHNKGEPRSWNFDVIVGGLVFCPRIKLVIVCHEEAIVYKDALTSELEFSSEPMVNPQHVNDVNWKIETSLSDSDDEKYDIIYDNDLFSYKIFPVNDLKLDMGNGDDKIDIKQSSGGLHTAEVTESVGFRAYWANSLREMASKAELRNY
ncbi:hypothetical protein Tco_0941158 [Tanacetum coccineum]|uniref:Uncharacterized protein n=1 Tax=Tanacetum coccineum TaxID=301880 RepID=A0ABQ5DSN4_9ASTR